MARSAGVTASAVAVFVGSALTILVGAVAILGMLLVNSRRTPNVPEHLASFMIIAIIAEAVFAFGFGGWGIASGVGLIQTREWARISMVVFAALLVLFTLPAALMMAFVPFPLPRDPNLPANFATMMRMSMVLFYGFFALLGGFWLYYFNTRSVKAQFQGKQAAAQASAAFLPAEMPSAGRAATAGARPLSITIIAWFLIICSAFGPLSLLYSREVFRVPLPMCFLGFFVPGQAAAWILMVWMAVQIIAAIGLLRLNNWARLATIALQCLGILNILLLVAIPGNRLRFQQAMNAAIASMNLQTPQPISFTFPAWIGMIVSLPLFVVILWFLITQKHAFVKRNLARVAAS